MKKFKKNWIKMNDTVQTDEVSEEITEETKEEGKMNFFAKHKKGLIIGGLGALTAGAVGLLIAKKGSDDDYEDADFDEFDDNEEVSEEADADGSEADA